MHDKIMDELKRQGVVRASSHQGIYKKKTDNLQSPRTRRMRENNNVESEQSPTMAKKEADQEIPQEIGRMRDDKKPRQPDLTLSMASTSTSHSDESREGDSVDRSSFMTVTSETESIEQEVKNYETGDPAEDKRLKKLHYAANEFYTVQKNFVKYLEHMERVYPNYVAEFGRRLGKDLLTPPPGQNIHPVRQMQKEFSQLVSFHEKVLLKEFTQQYATWDSEDPHMSSVILKYADFLKICIPFLKVKQKLVEELSRLREENKDFDNATTAFEQKCFNRGVGAVVQQLDQVHQNFMRYKILMISYQNYLKPDSEEYRQAATAIQKLESIAQKVNEAMGFASNEELFRLYDRFQTHFNVFVPGRRLIGQGDVMKQTRKEPQPRYLVLFSDVLWICRVASLSSGLFDLNRSYHIPLEFVTTETFQHEDFETQLKIKSKEKSFVLIFKTAKEATRWEQDIRQARDEKRRYKRRMSEALQKEKRQNSVPVLQPILSEELVEDAERPKSNGGAVLRNHSVDSPSSQPSTPVEDLGPPKLGEEIKTPPKGKVRRMDRDKPLWIPDEASSKCLMDGCGSAFSLLNRRHHCRDCGFLICSKCCGKAPISKCEYRKELVCPECYGKILDAYTDGTLFPQRMLVLGSNNRWMVKIKKKGSNSSELVNPQSLFTPPANMGLKRTNVETRVTVQDGAIFNEVFVRMRDGQEISRFAELTEGMMLKFFKMRLDKEPCEQHVIHGFELTETQLDEGGTLFELIHRNQIQTDRQEHVIAFRIQNQKSVQKWSAALHKAVGTSPSPTEEIDN